MGVKRGLSHLGKITGCRRGYLDLRERKWQEAGKDCIMRSFITLYRSPNTVRVIK
jgi:hypothetical protein